MSRAFVNEDASASNEAEAPEIKIPVPPGSRNYLTQAGADELAAELHELTAEARPRAQAELAAASSSGSGAGPDALAAARRRASEVDRRIAYLDAMAGLAEVVPLPPEGARDRVKFGAVVKTREDSGFGFGPASGPEAEYRIVGIDEADPERGLIGWPSPVARALMGRRAGETATVKLPTGDKRLLVVAIEYR